MCMSKYIDAYRPWKSKTLFIAMYLLCYYGRTTGMYQLSGFECSRASRALVGPLQFGLLVQMG